VPPLPRTLDVDDSFVVALKLTSSEDVNDPARAPELEAVTEKPAVEKRQDVDPLR